MTVSVGTAVSVADLNAVSVGELYGYEAIYSDATFERHAFLNDIDPRRSVRLTSGDGSPIAAALLGMRGERAWLGGFGVAPEVRGRGYGRACAEAVISAAAARGATSIELEVQTQNVAALRVYERSGFAIADELAVWLSPARGTSRGLELRERSEASIARVAAPGRAWQREPPAVARCGSSASIELGDAYAFIQASSRDPERAQLLDAGADTEAAARRLIDALELGREVRLLNEPVGSPLSAALHGAGWSVTQRQYRMRRSLTP